MHNDFKPKKCRYNHFIAIRVWHSELFDVQSAPSGGGGIIFPDQNFSTRIIKKILWSGKKACVLINKGKTQPFMLLQNEIVPSTIIPLWVLHMWD